MKKTLATVAIAASLTAIGAGAAIADDTYPAPAPATTVSQGTAQVGDTVTFSGSGFTPGEQIDITVGTDVSAGSSGTGSVSRAVGFRVSLAALQITTQADGSGKFSVEVPLPKEGVYTLTAKGVSSGITQTNTITVQAAAPVAGVEAQASQVKGGLPETGADGLLTWGLIGAGALAAGGISTILVRRNSKAVAA